MPSSIAWRAHLVVAPLVIHSRLVREPNRLSPYSRGAVGAGQKIESFGSSTNHGQRGSDSQHTATSRGRFKRRAAVFDTRFELLQLGSAVRHSMLAAESPRKAPRRYYGPLSFFRLHRLKIRYSYCIFRNDHARLQPHGER
jgi:hypothetical protein